MITVRDIENLVPELYKESDPYEQRRIRSLCRKILMDYEESLNASTD